MTFSDQEIKLLDLVSTGATSSEIASKMDYTEGTIRVYLHKLYRKLDVRNRTEAAVWWLKEKANVAEKNTARRLDRLRRDELAQGKS